jgi:hypothetical protein
MSIQDRCVTGEKARDSSRMNSAGSRTWLSRPGAIAAPLLLALVADDEPDH